MPGLVQIAWRAPEFVHMVEWIAVRHSAIISHLASGHPLALNPAETRRS